MDDGGVNESGSQHSRPSSESSVSDSKKRKKSPCEVCGRYVNENNMITCFRYCSGRNFGARIWACDEYNSSIRDSNESATSRTNQAASSSRTNKEENEVVYSNEISATNPPSQTHTSPTVEEASSPVSIGTSPVQEQKQSDKDTLSDSESAN